MSAPTAGRAAVHRRARLALAVLLALVVSACGDQGANTQAPVGPRPAPGGTVIGATPGGSTLAGASTVPRPDRRVGLAGPIEADGTVTLLGSGWPADAPLLVVQCGQEVTARPSGACDPTTAMAVTTAVDGSFEAVVQVQPTLRLDAVGDVDCRERARRCNLSAVSVDDPGVAGGVGLDLGASIPTPPGT